MLWIGLKTKCEIWNYMKLIENDMWAVGLGTGSQIILKNSYLCAAVNTYVRNI